MQESIGKDTCLVLLYTILHQELRLSDTEVCYFRYRVITRHICSEISGRANETHPATENVKKAYVFLNPSADNGNARGKFEKYALPILNLAEFEVILIEVHNIILHSQ